MLASDASALKQQLIETAILALTERIHHAENAMKEAQESANQEEKSSAGDKYETGRAMGQLQRDMNAKQSILAKKELAFLQQLNTNPKETIGTGSIVKTATAYYFVSIGLGTIDSNQGKVHLISIESPIGKLMNGLKVNDQFQFLDLVHQIEFIG